MLVLDCNVNLYLISSFYCEMHQQWYANDVGVGQGTVIT